MKSGLVRLAFCLLAFQRGQATPILVNGSFEAPSLPANSMMTSGGAFWTANGSNVFVISNNFNNLGITPFGNQYLELTPGGSDQQSIDGFQAGRTYTIDLYFADLAGGPNPSLSTFLSGAIKDVGVFNAPVGGPYGGGNISFELAELSFTPIVDGTVNLLLSNIGDSALAVDNVTIRQAVPESENTSVLFALVLTPLALIRSSRRS